MAKIQLPTPKSSWRERVKGSPATVRTLVPRPRPAQARRLVVTGKDPRRKGRGQLCKQRA